MSAVRNLLLGSAFLLAAPAFAADVETSATTAKATTAEAAEQPDIVVTGSRQERVAPNKTDGSPLETPQPITSIAAETYLAQGAVSIGDTLNYVSGVQANPYGPDSRLDSAFIRGITALQFRDGMRDIFSYYATIRADPYNFSRVDVVRGPSSVLFGAGAIGGIVNLASKIPQAQQQGEILVRYGSFNRKEVLADVNAPITGGIQGRLIARVRDSDTQTDFVPDDRVMLAPSLCFGLGANTDLTLIGLYQEDDGGSVAQFLPLVGTILPNPNGQLPSDRFVGKPGWDRYDGRLLQGTVLLDHRIGDRVHLSGKARYIDSDLSYFTHYPDNYTNPANPFLDPAQRLMGLYVDASVARMEIFSSDNNARFTFNTGSGIEHDLLAGIDYSWNRIRKVGGFAFETIDIYAPDYGSLLDYGGGLPEPTYEAERTRQRSVGLYVQDQIRIQDRITVVVGARRDWTRARAFDGAAQKDSATTFRAGVIGELVPGVSPFASYTESFEPIAGTASNGNPFVPKTGKQAELGLKWHPNANTLVTLTGYRIKERNRPISDDTTADPFDQVQAGSLTSKGIEIEGRSLLPGRIELIGNYSYNEAEIDGSGQQLENVPKHNASIWATKRVALRQGAELMIGGGVRHVAKNLSYGPAFPNGITTPAYTLVDAVAELNLNSWSLAVNAVNLFDKRYYSACLARGDCFLGNDRNLFATLGYRF